MTAPKKPPHESATCRDGIMGGKCELCLLDKIKAMEAENERLRAVVEACELVETILFLAYHAKTRNISATIAQSVGAQRSLAKAHEARRTAGLLP